MDLENLITQSYPDLAYHHKTEELALAVRYLIEGNTKEDLALMLFEALGEEGTDMLIVEAKENGY